MLMYEKLGKAIEIVDHDVFRFQITMSQASTMEEVHAE